MVEKTEDEKKEEESKSTDTGEGSKPKATDVVAEARAEREKLEAANKERKEILDREEALAAKRELGGDTEGGQQAVKKEETDKEYRQRIDKEISEGKHDD